MSQQMRTRSQCSTAALILLFLASLLIPSSLLAATLPAPTLSAKLQSGPQVSLTWAMPRAAISGFQLQRSLEPTSGFTTIKTVDKSVYSATDTAVQAGSGYYYRVRCYKKGTPTTYSAFSNVVFVDLPPAIDATPPTVSITSPTSGASYSAAQTVSITASAQDNVGVSKVEFYNGGILKKTATAAPYSHDWAVTSADNGTHSFTAKAYDAIGNVANSTAVSINVNVPAPQPGSFEFSLSNYSASEGAGKVDITIKRVGGSDGIATVNWRTNSVTATFDQDYASFSWTTLTFASGEASKTLTVGIIDDALVEGDETFNVSLGSPTGGAGLGSITVSSVRIIDNDNNSDSTPPVVSVTSPAAGASYTAAQTVLVTASAQDNVGVSKVEFYDAGILKGTDTTAPYGYDWAVTSADNGSHSFVAKAYDAAGNVASSAAVSLTVNIQVTDDPFAGPVKVFPGAVGFGTETVAGRGGKLLRVTNLNDSGTGSLRAAVESSGARIVVFEVSGTINLLSKINIYNPFLTIAGQTAPSPGVTIKGGGFNIRSHDILIQHLRIRVGDQTTVDPSDLDSFQIIGTNTYNVVLDHVSSSWAIDENGSTWASLNNITISNSIFSEGLQNSIHPKGPHSKGFIIGNNSKKVAFIGNLVAHNKERQPRVCAGATAVVANNVLYNVGTSVHMAIGESGGATPTSTPYPDSPAQLSAVGNVFIPGPNTTTPHRGIDVLSGPYNEGTKVYLADNRVVNGTEMTYSTTANPRVATPPLWVSDLTARPSATVESWVLGNAGARPADRDAVDARIAQEVSSRTGGIIDSQKQVGGWPLLRNNVRVFPAPANPNGDDNGNGYTNIEEVIDQMTRQCELSSNTQPAAH